MDSERRQRERLADGVIHGLGVAGSVAAVAFLLDIVVPRSDALAILAASVYGAALVAMLWLSAAYNMASHPERKERVRRYDHAAIFVMIAGTYTPFALIAVGGPAGRGLLALVWLIATAGVVLKLSRPRAFERTSLALYLALGWIGFPVLGPLFGALPAPMPALLVLGGVLYTAGVGFHLWERLPYQNAVWHGFVLAGAGCHFVAVVMALGGGDGS